MWKKGKGCNHCFLRHACRCPSHVTHTGLPMARQPPKRFKRVVRISPVRYPLFSPVMFASLSLLACPCTSVDQFAGEFRCSFVLSMIWSVLSFSFLHCPLSVRDCPADFRLFLSSLFEVPPSFTSCSLRSVWHLQCATVLLCVQPVALHARPLRTLMFVEYSWGFNTSPTFF